MCGGFVGLSWLVPCLVLVSDALVAVVSLVLVRLSCGWCWFWLFRGYGPIDLCLFGSLSVSVLFVVVVSLALVFGSCSVFVLVISVSGKSSMLIITKESY